MWKNENGDKENDATWKLNAPKNTELDFYHHHKNWQKGHINIPKPKNKNKI